LRTAKLEWQMVTKILNVIHIVQDQDYELRIIHADFESHSI